MKRILRKGYFSAAICLLGLSLSLNARAQVPQPPRKLAANEFFVTYKTEGPNAHDTSYIVRSNIKVKITRKDSTANIAVPNQKLEELSKQNADLRKELDEIKALLKK